MLKEFRSVHPARQLVDLAVAVVIGTAFAAVVTALVKDIMTPLIAAWAARGTSAVSPSRSTAALPLRRLPQRARHVPLVAAVVFFLVVKPVNALLGAVARQH